MGAGAARRATACTATAATSSRPSCRAPIGSPPTTWPTDCAAPSPDWRPTGRTPRVTISIGVACFPDDGRRKDALVTVADRAMYLAKPAARSADAGATGDDPYLRALDETALALLDRRDSTTPARDHPDPGLCAPRHAARLHLPHRARRRGAGAPPRDRAVRAGRRPPSVDPRGAGWRGLPHRQAGRHRRLRRVRPARRHRPTPHARCGRRRPPELRRSRSSGSSGSRRRPPSGPSGTARSTR